MGEEIEPLDAIVLGTEIGPSSLKVSSMVQGKSCNPTYVTFELKKGSPEARQINSGILAEEVKGENPSLNILSAKTSKVLYSTPVYRELL
jgi:hypothetical protein